MPSVPRCKIVAYDPGYARPIAELFTRAVHAVSDEHYNLAQRNAWAPRPPDFEKWQARLAQKQPYLALIGHGVAGFIELEADGHIDCAYVDPLQQRSGVGRALYLHLEAEARKRGMARLFVEASIMARPFFAGLGFTLVKENRVERAGQVLTNYSMEKTLNPAS